MHVTLNFDVGIEVAYELLTGRRALPETATATYARPLRAWQQLLPPDPPPLPVVVACKQDFDHWVADGRPPGLLKVHGSLRLDQQALLDPVVVDIEELAQLPPGRAAAVQRIADTQRLLVTGYAGEDIDCYAALLEHVGPGTDWRQYSGGQSVRQATQASVRDAVVARGGRFLTGEPDGLAVTGLLEVLGLPAAPAWPAGPAGLDRYERRLREWAELVRREHAVEDLACTTGWLLADVGRHDVAVQVLRRTAARRPTPAQRMRLASVLYERADSGDRREAAQLFRRITLDRRAPRGTRFLALLRVGDEARGRLVAGSPAALALCVVAPVAVLALTRSGQVDPESAATAYRALQQLALRLGERAAAAVPVAGRKPLAGVLQQAARLGSASVRLTSNGNAAGLARQHRLALLVLAALLQGRTTSTDVRGQLEALHAAYLHGDDLPGGGNCSVTLGLADLADGDADTAWRRLGQARGLYADSRIGPPSPAGMAYAAAAERLISKFSRAL